MSALTDPTDRAQRILANRYRLLVALGVGESAKVFLAQDLALGRRVAIKLLKPELDDNQAFLRCIRAEAHAVAVLNHPNIVRVFDWVEDPDGPFLVLEYLAGGSLRDLLDRGARLSPAETAQVGGQVARGLAYAHTRGLVHRDVKPANLLFDEEGRVRVTDFGVARALAEAAWIEPGGIFIGTPRYSAPEQARGGAVDGRSDVYALALVLYEAITGVVPFTSDTIEGTLIARVDQPLPPHPALGPMHELLSRAADPDVSSRLNATQLATLLEEAADLWPAAVLPGAPSTEAGNASTDATVMTPLLPQTDRMPATAHPDDTLSWAQGAGTPRRPEPGPARPARRRRRRWPWLVALLVMALVGAGVVVARQEKVFTPSHPVPSLKGLSATVARQELRRMHLSLAVGTRASSTTVLKGEVVSQRPKTATSLKEGDVVTVVVSTGLPMESVPSLVGLSCYGATRVLAVAHLEASCPQAAAAYNDAVPAGQVINWSYDNRLNATQAPFGSTIIIAISQGKPVVTVPSLVSATYAQAQATLRSVGLQVTEVRENSVTVAAGSVTRTLPPAGAGAVTDSTVIVFVSLGPAIVKVPNVRHDTVPVATAALKKAGFTVGTISGPADGQVDSTNPPAGQFEPQGTTVALTTK
jgi:eukaryotic-like serine/threonine-protein kinase